MQGQSLELKGSLRVITFCLTTFILPCCLLVFPLYIRYIVFQDVKYLAKPGGLIIIDHPILSSIWCEKHDLWVNTSTATFDAYLLKPSEFNVEVVELRINQSLYYQTTATTTKKPDNYYYKYAFADENYMMDPSSSNEYEDTSVDIRTTPSKEGSDLNTYNQLESCVNATFCSFPVDLWSSHKVLLKSNEESFQQQELVSRCRPRQSIYFLFPFFMMCFILFCSFL